MYTYSLLFCLFPLALSTTTPRNVNQTTEQSFFTVKSTTMKIPHQDAPAPFFMYYAPQYYIGCGNEVKPSNSISASLGPKDEWYIIRSVTSGLVADALDANKITVEHFTGHPSQLWKFERATKPGVYYIINNSTGTVLDVYDENVQVRLKEKNGASSQHWVLNSNGHIYNIGKEQSLDVHYEKFVPGHFMHVWPDKGQAVLQYTLQPKP